jgi:hypothetical protein
VALAAWSVLMLAIAACDQPRCTKLHQERCHDAEQVWQHESTYVGIWAQTQKVVL